jgi:MYXO-CTERM domain-containing protein
LLDKASASAAKAVAPTGFPMTTKSVRITVGLAAFGLSSLAVASPIVFDVSGTITSDYPPPPTSTLSGTLTIDPVTGALDAADVDFTSPSTSIPTVPALTFFGPETAPGPAGSHAYEVELCAVSGCAGNWLIELVLDVTPTTPSLVGYTGGPIESIGLFYTGVQDTWGACSPSSLVESSCGALSTKSSPPPPVPEPDAYSLMLTALAAMGLLARRRRRA